MSDFDYNQAVKQELQAEIEQRKTAFEAYKAQLKGKPQAEIEYHALFLFEAKREIEKCEQLLAKMG